MDGFCVKCEHHTVVQHPDPNRLVNEITMKMLTDIETNYHGEFYFHSLSEIYCRAFHDVFGEDQHPSKPEVNRGCDDVMSLIRERYPYTNIKLER